jgi:hypothetical protein
MRKVKDDKLSSEDSATPDVDLGRMFPRGCPAFAAKGLLPARRFTGSQARKVVDRVRALGELEDFSARTETE